MNLLSNTLEPQSKRESSPEQSQVRRGDAGIAQGSIGMNQTNPAWARSASGSRVDPVTASIIYGALENIAVEMGFKLMRMSYSSIIRESEDFGAALCDAPLYASLWTMTSPARRGCPRA